MDTTITNAQQTWTLVQVGKKRGDDGDDQNTSKYEFRWKTATLGLILWVTTGMDGDALFLFYLNHPEIFAKGVFLDLNVGLFFGTNNTFLNWVSQHVVEVRGHKFCAVANIG